MISPRLLSLTDAGIYLGRSLRAMEQLVRKRVLPTVRYDRRVYLDIKDLDKFIESQKA